MKKKNYFAVKMECIKRTLLCWKFTIMILFTHDVFHELETSH